MTHRSTARIVGYQLVYGFGVGMGFGQPSYVVQTLLPVADVPIGVTFITLVQNLSAAIFVAVAQSIFNGEMRRHLTPLVPPEDASDILGSGLANVLAELPPDIREQALEAISTSIVKTFYVSLALSTASVVGVGVKWASMKNGNADETLETKEAVDNNQATAEKQHDIVTNQEREGQIIANEAIIDEGK